MRTIRVALLIDNIRSQAGGTENQTISLLQRLDRTRVQPYLCLLESSNWLQKNCPNFPVVTLGLPKISSLRFSARFASVIRFLANERIDVLQTHFIAGNAIGCAAAFCLPPLVLISSRRNQGFWHTTAHKRALALLNRRVDLFVANCTATRDWASAAECIPPERIEVIYNGVDLSRFDYDRESVRAAYRSELSLSPGEPLIGIVANLRPPKSINVFLRAARELAVHMPDVRFAVVGDGPQKAELYGLAADLGISSKVRFLGRRDDVPRLLSAFDVGVLSSTSESMPSSILEYMAAALPVVCTDVGGCREAVVQSETGYVVPPSNPNALAHAILSVLRNGEAKAMGERGRARVEAMFGLDEMVRRYEQLYSRLASGGRRAARTYVAHSSTQDSMPIAQEGARIDP